MADPWFPGLLTLPVSPTLALSLCTRNSALTFCLEPVEMSLPALGAGPSAVCYMAKMEPTHKFLHAVQESALGQVLRG